MLILSFLTACAASLCWLVIAAIYISSKVPLDGILTLSPSDVALYAVIACIPLFVIWAVWGHFYHLRHELKLQRQFSLLSEQIRQNNEYSDVIARVLIKNSSQQVHAFAFSKIELYINEMNEILADVINRANLLDEERLYSVWKMAGFGNRWGFAKAIIDIRNNDSDFDARLVNVCENNPLLLSSLKEFCARYTRLLKLLKEHDEENILQEIMETGVFGKVFAVFADIIRGDQEKKTISQINSEIRKEPYLNHPEFNAPQEEITEEKEPENKRRGWLKRIFAKHDGEEEKKNDVDVLTLALERSFGASDETSEPVSKPAEEKEMTLSPEVSLPVSSSLPEDEPLPFLEEKEELAAEPDVKPQPELSKQPILPEETPSQNLIETTQEKLTKTSQSLPEETAKEVFLQSPAEDVVAEVISSPAEEKILALPDDEPIKMPASRFAFANTDKTIKNLQKEWEEMKKNDLAMPSFLTEAKKEDEFSEDEN